MTEQEKRRRQNRNFLIVCAVLYLAIAYLTLHITHQLELMGKPVTVQNIDYRLLLDATEKSIKEDIIVWPSRKTIKILFLELIATFVYGLYQITTRKNLMAGKEHGTAKWGGGAERNRIRDKQEKRNIILSQTERLSLDTRKTRKNLNILAIGGAGTGKSRFFVKPNLLQANTSLVITDPKGELLRDTGHALESKGYKIKVFNLINMAESSGYNPFRYVRRESDILKVIHLLIKNTNGSKSNSDPFWESAEKSLLQAVFLYIYYELPAFEHNMATVFKMLRLAEVKEEDEEYLSEFDYLFELLREENPDHIAVKQYDIFKMAAGKTAKSILISAGVRLSPFGIQDVERLVKEDELDIGKIGEERTALFILIPDSDTTFNFLVAMMYAQLFDTLYYEADFKHEGRLPHHVKFWLDEFANIGQIPDFDKLIATMRSREISVSVILQNLTQLKGIYKDSWETIVGNCDTILFLGGQERSTLEWVNKGLGKQTIDTRSTSRSRGRNGSSSTSYGTQGRDLMTVDEIAQMPDNKCILFVRGLSPFYSEKYNLKKHPDYKLLYEAKGDFFEAAMRWKPDTANHADVVAQSVNIRSPDKDMLNRLEEISVVSIEQLEDMESKMNALL